MTENIGDGLPFFSSAHPDNNDVVFEHFSVDGETGEYIPDINPDSIEVIEIEVMVPGEIENESD